MNNQNYVAFYKPGYWLVTASNGDWDAYSKNVQAVATQQDYGIAFFAEYLSGMYRFSLLWAKK